jgi:SAM-dependent methyltransferase
MKRAMAWGRLVPVLALLAGVAQAAVAPQDAPFVPTPQPVVEAMLRLAGVGAGDVVYDLGSGDGRVVITAARLFGARGVGVELDSHLVIQSEEAARQAGVERRVTILEQDLFTVDLAPATVVTIYLWSAMYDRLMPRLARLKPGTRIVVYRWALAGWKPEARGGTGEESYYLYRVPGQAAGPKEVQTR